jgi:hypothetical protein
MKDGTKGSMSDELNQPATKGDLLLTAKTLQEDVIERLAAMFAPAKQEAPAPMDAELVERMIDAYWQDARPCESCKEGQATGMAAALRVAADALLGPVTEAEIDKLHQPATAADLRQAIAAMRWCGICWAGVDGVRLHYCSLPLGHNSDHQCHCGETLKGPAKLAQTEPRP